MKAVVFTLGCKVNEVESSSIIAALKEAGFEVSDKLEFADIYILNTCAVTREAERKSRQLIARAKKFNQAADIFVLGCASEKDPESFIKKGVTFVWGAQKKEEVIKALSLKYSFDYLGFPAPLQTKTRAFIKIQDGCNNFCSYCIIPYLRGRETSRPIEEIVEEVKNCDSAEVVLNGINISAYSYGLENLIYSLRGVEKRIRLGSLECSKISEEFLRSLKALPDFAPQFHLSLQSGSNKVLKDMNRHYTREQFIEKCRLIYSYFPDCAITTDIISGFATESEEDFLETLSIIEEVGFARVHAFSYSPREGTTAYKLKDLPPEIKSERLHRLIQAGDKAAKEYTQKFLGKVLEIVAEEYDGSYTCGYTENYIRAYVPKELTAGAKYKVKIIKIFKDGVLSTLYE